MAVRRSKLTEVVVVLILTCMAFLSGQIHTELLHRPTVVTSSPVITLSDSSVPTNTTGRPLVNVFAFVLYGSVPMIVEGAALNAVMIPKLFRGWRARFYIDNTVDGGTRQRLHDAGADVVVVPDSWMNWNEARRMWRYAALADESVGLALFRDVDSRVSIREMAAISEWLQVLDQYPFHAMHDHYEHTVPILGGMFGAHSSSFREVFPDPIARIAQYATSKNIGKQTDQAWLAQDVYPVIKDRILLHDSFLCNAYGPSRPFPLPRSYHADFVGNVLSEGHNQDSLYYRNGAKEMGGREAPLRCRLRPEYAFG
ncbi:unnamed protein product (mitochondrion) [Plasmodiophora brassicae]|uniref:DUF5672 domain-containing protein n=1 Tax=Plasmodiophora brassicae TaxID=37360 RepID=A0A0G4IPV4_PLABS|nr:hypothetical protein PBRA_005773 [Plasmodiophora brassicae]SPR01144.1 unnamed protein product [Plasmodiophora brassicae]